jgi:hypothetical protein
MQEKNEKIIQHILTIEQRKSVRLSGVDSVLSFSGTKITLKLADGTSVYVAGTDLKITAFSKESGNFCAVGSIVGVSYGGKGFAAKLFK